MIRELFPGSVILEGATLTALWASATIVFDTNVLMDFHAWTNVRSGWFLSQCEHEYLKRRLWLPHQVAREFTRNRSVRLRDRQKKIAESIGHLREDHDRLRKTLLSELTRSRLEVDETTFPDISTPLNEWLRPFIETLELEQQDLKRREDLVHDDVFERIERLYAGVIGQAFSRQEELALYQEGEQRYQGKIPPGFGDSRKDKPEDYRYFGDLLLWKQVIDHAKTEQIRGVILVTNDSAKNDWFSQNRQPHEQLTEEFHTESGGKSFWLYTFKDFLHEAEAHGLITGEQQYALALRDAENDDEDREEEMVSETLAAALRTLSPSMGLIGLQAHLQQLNALRASSLPLSILPQTSGTEHLAEFNRRYRDLLKNYGPPLAQWIEMSSQPSLLQTDIDTSLQHWSTSMQNRLLSNALPPKPEENQSD